MSKNLKWPVAKVREDGTPAIWLTHSNWLLLKDGIVRKYLDECEGLARYHVRREARQKLGGNWVKHLHLKSWGCLDLWPTWLSDINAAMEIFVAGYEAWKHVKGLGITSGPLADWTPESLAAAGERHKQRGREEELKNIGDLSCDTTRVESVAAIVADHPKEMCPGDRSVSPAVSAVNPGRALEVAGQEVPA